MASCRARRACARSRPGWRATRRGFIIWARAPVRRSTLADANALRPGAVFAELFALMIGAGPRGLRRKLGRGDLSDRFDRAAARPAAAPTGRASRRGLRRQGAVDLRSRRRPADLCRGHRRQRQRHHRRPRRCRSSPAPPMSSISAITIIAGGPSSIERRLPHRHPLQIQHAADRGRGTAGADRQRPSSPTASAICRRARPRAAAIRSRIRCARSASGPRPARCCAS